MPSIDSAWEQLKQRGSAGTYIGIEQAHPGKVFAALNASGHPGLVLYSKEKLPVVDRLSSIDVVSDRSEVGYRICLWLEDSSLEQIFCQLCDDLLESTRSSAADDLPSALVHRLESWRQLLDLGPSGALGKEATRGLIGELLVLEHSSCAMDSALVLESWCGGFKTSHDFALEKLHIEVKTVGLNANAVSISSLEQLEMHYEVPLLLAVIFLAESSHDQAHCFTLPSLVLRLSHTLRTKESQQMFAEKLRARGYAANASYENVWYRRDAIRYYLITATFPKLCRDDVRNEIVQAAYSLSFSGIEDYEDVLERYV